MGMKESLKTRLDSMEPEQRRKLTISAVVVVLLVLATIVVLINDDPSSRQRRSAAEEPPEVGNVIMRSDARELGLAGLSNELQQLRSDVGSFRAENEQLRRDIERLRQLPPGSRQSPDAALQSLQSDVAEERRTIGPPPGTVMNPDRPGPQPILPQDRGIIRPTGPGQPGGPGGAVEAGAVREAPQISVTRSQPQVQARSQRPARAERRVFIPTGSMMTGVLLNGLDAPTGRAAQSQPLPVVVRVQHEAILPSFYRSDVREAFILAAGFGDLSSERAYLRAERFSMILNDGRVIDIPIKAAASGDDGKAGIRGRLVSKQGSAIAKAVLAGTADGISRAFSGQRNGFRGDGIPSTDQMLISGAGGGVSGGLDRVAAYFLSQAESMYPVIEVDGGREVTFILLEGLELTPRQVEEAIAQEPAAGRG
jgi:conjugal transfer pilus assembly protein TraB